MLAASFRKRFFYLSLISFFVLPILPETSAQQKPPAPNETDPPVYDQKVCEQIYEDYLEIRKNDITREQRKAAIKAGWKFLEKCSENPENRNIVKYLERHLPRPHGDDIRGKSVVCFDEGVKDVKNLNAERAFACGKYLLLNSDPDSIDVMLVLASIGFDLAVARKPVDTYNAEAISYAKQAIQKIESGVTSRNKQYGAWSFSYKTKENALAWMNFTIGYIMYFRQGNKKEAIPYLYRATLYETGGEENPKNNANIYQLIGDYYKDEYNRLDEERTGLAIKAMGKSSEAELKPLRDKAKELLARQKKYGEKMFDAYARAYHLAGQDKVFRDTLYNTLKIIYGFIFDGKRTGFKEYLNNVVNSPMPEPE